MLVAAAAGAKRQAPVMFVFGDSTLDVGNNNFLSGAAVPRANKPHYGVDFPGGHPTGRFSNGDNTADFVAKSMGLKSSPPPYLSLAPNGSSPLLAQTALTTGVSYASADAGVLDSTNEGKCIPLSTQVGYFNGTKAKMVAKKGAAAVSKLLADSVILMGIANNDLFVFAAAELLRGRSAAEQKSDAAAFLTDLLSNYSAAITDLHSIGARKFAIINVGLVGCVPVVRVLDADGGCAEGLNKLAEAFDVALGPLLAGLADKLPGLTYSLANSFRLTQDAFADPKASGYSDVASACCGSGRLLAEADCLPNSTVCSDHDSHVFWDRYHPAQRACNLTARAFYDGPAKYTTPINFMKLAQAS